MSPMVSVNLGCVLWALHLRHKFGFAVWHQKCREFGAQPSVQKLRLLSLAVLWRCFRSSSSIDALFSTRFSTLFCVWMWCGSVQHFCPVFRCSFRFQAAAERWSGLGTERSVATERRSDASQLSPGWVGKCPIFGTNPSPDKKSFWVFLYKSGLRRCPFSNLIHRLSGQMMIKGHCWIQKKSNPYFWSECKATISGTIGIPIWRQIGQSCVLGVAG